MYFKVVINRLSSIIVTVSSARVYFLYILSIYFYYRGSKPSSADNLTSELTHESQQSSDNYVVDKVQQTIDEVAANYDGHADYEGTSASTVKPGSLKMKLSGNKVIAFIAAVSLFVCPANEKY